MVIQSETLLAEQLLPIIEPESPQRGVAFHV
jgi:hypothetical protein